MRTRTFSSLAYGVALSIGAILPVTLDAGPRSSASYRAPTETLDAGGGPNGSASYSNAAAIGGMGGVSTVAAPAQVARHGYLGQLYQVTGLVVSANSTNVNEGASRQLQAQAILDDGTVLQPAGPLLEWQIVSGPIASVNAAGLANAGAVYQDTPATVQATFLSAAGSIGLRVLNVVDDNYGAYANDGLNDAWQVQSFGENHAQAGPAFDPDNDGQNNGYEYLAGSIPTDGGSFFRFRIETVLGQPDQKQLIFSPRVAGRTYTVESKTDLNAPGFVELIPITVMDAGAERTVTDLSATAPEKFYRVRISMP